MSQIQDLKQYIQDFEVGLALRLDDLGARLEGIENDLAVIKARLPSQSRIDPLLVAERLNLTPTESRVAVALAEGNTVRLIAEAMRRKESTIRWFLRQIYRKLSISREVELVRLVLLLTQETATRHKPDTETAGACNRNPGC